jgi:methionyl-tRNA formyltransferase
MRRLRVVFIGCVQFSRAMLEELLALPGIDLCGVVTRKSSAINADFVDLSALAAAGGGPVYLATGNEQEEIASWIREKEADICFCIGWSYLLKSPILSATAHGVVGYHPALLPRNRGRHPIIWALALGLPETGSSFFYMDSGADSGPLLSQVRVTISKDDDASSLYGKLVEVARLQIRRLVMDMLNAAIVGVPQDPSLATYWRKRVADDGRIDWRMPAAGIHNLVRALTLPYPGAHAHFRNAEVKVWKTRLAPKLAEDIEPGFVIDRNGTDIHVQCGEGTIILERHDFDQVQGLPLQRGDYL